MIKINEYRNYKRITVIQNNGKRIYYCSTLTNRIFCDGFQLGTGNRDRDIREGERIFKLGSIDPNIQNDIKFVSNEKS